MSRRSSRLASGGHNHSDEESDSSSVTNISYRENPVKVFKKKAGTRKSHSRTLTRANSNASSESPKTSITADQDDVSPSPSRSQTPPTTRTVTYVPTVATPRPALTLSSPRSWTPSCRPSVPPEKSLHAGPCSSYRPGSHLAPQHKELGQCGVDSSGYSSSEGPLGRPSTGGIRGNSGAPGAGHAGRISSSFFSLMDSVSVMAALVQSKVTPRSASAKSSVSSNTTKACGLLLLLLLLLLMLILSVWFLLPSLTSPVSVTKAQQTKPPTQPTTPATPPPPPPLSSTTRPIPVADPAVAAAAVEAKIWRLTEQLQLKQEQLQLEQEQLLSEMSERLQLRMRDMEARLEALDLDGRLRLEQELTGMDKRLADYQTESRSAAADVSLRFRALEARNAQLSEEWSSFRVMPLPVPCLDTSPAHNQLTPELQQAMEKWFAERLKEQDAVRLAGKGSCSDCGRPMADKMADFALETQGASVISTRCSETYRIRSACVTLFGFPLWYPSESPRTVIQGFPVLLPGKCWAFHGVQGTLVISLSHPIRISHVTLDHLPRYSSPTGHIDSAPKDFEVYGMNNDTEEGALLGRFTYDESGESTQTFELPTPSDAVHRFVELRVLTNWGHVEYTCLYRFRVHGQISTT